MAERTGCDDLTPGQAAYQHATFVTSAPASLIELPRNLPYAGAVMRARSGHYPTNPAHVLSSAAVQRGYGLQRPCDARVMQGPAVSLHNAPLAHAQAPCTSAGFSALRSASALVLALCATATLPSRRLLAHRAGVGSRWVRVEVNDGRP